jgi:hypothetical protein
LRRRLLGWALLLYGLAGVALVTGGALVGLDAAARVERLAAAANGTLEAAARSTEAAAQAFVNVDGSLAESETSADAASALARDASATLASLSLAMELSVFGAQPLLPLAGEFDASADQASALGETLDRVAASLGDTRVDVAGIGAQLDGLSTELAILRDSTGTGGDPPPVQGLVLLLLGWLMVPAIGGVLAGLVLLRRPPPATTS